MNLFEHFLKAFSLYLEARIRIRVRIKVKGRIRIRIRIKMMRICNTDVLCIRRIRRRCLYLSNFSFSHEDGLPHERSFTLICVIGKYRETGAGKSKKLAKRQVRSWRGVIKNQCSGSGFIDSGPGSSI